jgi:hypothetical protein
MRLHTYLSAGALSILLLAPLSECLAQKKPIRATQSKLKKAAPGTYQLQVFTNKSEIAFSDEVLYWIEAERHATEERFLHLGEQAGVLIPSRKTISASGFKPLEEKIIRTR